MADRIQIRRDTDADWTSNNPTLAAGEPGFVSDTDELVVGDGTTAFTSLGRAKLGDVTVQTYTPDVTATVTDPTRDNNGTRDGSYVVEAGICTVWVRIVNGSTGTNGSGAYIVDLPVAAAGLSGSTAAGTGASIGTGHLRDDDATANNQVVGVQLRTATSVSLVQGVGAFVTESSPFVFNDADVISFMARYPTV